MGPAQLTYEEAMRNAWGQASSENVYESRVWLDIAKELGEHGPIPPNDPAAYQPDESIIEIVALAKIVDLVVRSTGFNDGDVRKVLLEAGLIHVNENLNFSAGPAPDGGD